MSEQLERRITAAELPDDTTRQRAAVAQMWDDTVAHSDPARQQRQ